jgi:hypothetical protein
MLGNQLGNGFQLGLIIYLELLAAGLQAVI